MSEMDHPTRIQSLEQTLQQLRAEITAVANKIDGVEKNIQKFAAAKTRVERLRIIKEAKTRTELETLSSNLAAIRQELDPRDSGIKRVVKSFFKTLLTYWPLISFLVVALVAIYIYCTYGVGYFEPYKNVQNTKQSARYYANSGDRLVARAEFGAAEQEYRTAVEINPYDIAARRGLMLSQVLISDEGAPLQYSEVTEAKLNYLENAEGFKDNPLLSYFHGRLAAARGDRKSARDYFQASISQLDCFNKSHPNQRNEFIGNYIEIGILDMWEGKINDAIASFETPLVGDQKTALNHLAECYLVSQRFEDAWTVLSKLIVRSPRVETYLVLGDFFRYQYATNPVKYKRNLESAITMDKLAYKTLTGTGSTNSDSSALPKLAYGKDYGRMHFLPIPLQDVPTFGQSVVGAETPDRYLALDNYALSLDYALAGDFNNANTYNDHALATDVFKEYPCQFVYKTRFYRSKMSPLEACLRSWFDAKAESLTAGRCKAATGAKS